MQRQLPGFRIVASVHRSASTQVLRAQRLADGERVVLKLPADPSPTPRALAQLELAWSIGRELSHPHIVPHLDLVPVGRSRALVMADDGAASLDLAAWGALGGQRVLELGVAVADALAAVHEAGIVHRDVKPHNIVVNAETGVVRLIDFDIATRITRGCAEAAPPEALEGTLAYIAPEQTGRTNRGVDGRCDLYGLGVTLFQLFAGRLPFEETDPLALVHAHLARSPPRLDTVAPHVPEGIADVVERLLAKSPEDRYQSARGLRADLERCRAQLERSGTVPRFPLGRGDRSGRFHIPDRLYGREAEAEALVAAFGRVTEGGVELALVTGPSGIGKSALVGELRRPLALRRGWYAAGRFDPSRRDLPYEALTQVLGQLIRAALALPEDELAAVRTRVGSALGDAGGALFEVVPDLSHLLDELPSRSELGPLETRNRLRHLFLRLMHALASAEHPLVVFLDDLQWADHDSLELLRGWLSSPATRYVLLIGAWRDDEIDPRHPAHRLSEELAAGGLSVVEHRLGPLSVDSIGTLLGDTLGVESDEKVALAARILEKTGGNAFFVREMLQRLHDDQVIRLTDTGWTWSLRGVDEAEITANVVDLLTARLQELPSAARRVVVHAACIGTRFELGTLALLEGRPLRDVAADIELALVRGLLVPLGSDWRYAATEAGGAGGMVCYRFRHDRIREAAWALLEGDSRAAVHLQLGRLLLRRGAPVDDDVLGVANHFLVAGGSVGDPADRLAIADLHLRAGTRALASAAGDVAARHLDAGLALLPSDAWESDYPLCLGLHARAAEAAVLCDDMLRLGAEVAAVRAGARDIYDEVPSITLHAKTLSHRGEHHASIELLLETLGRFGVGMPRSPGLPRALASLVYTRWLLRGRDPMDLAESSAAEDRRVCTVVELLAWLRVPAFSANPSLYAVASLRILQLHLRHGSTPWSAVGLSAYAAMVSKVQADFVLADRYGEAATAVARRSPELAVWPTCLFFRGWASSHWLRPLAEVADETLDGWARAQRCGEPLVSAYAAKLALYLELFSGRSLADLLHDYEPHIHWFRQMGDRSAATGAYASYQLAAILVGQDGALAKLRGSFHQPGQVAASDGVTDTGISILEGVLAVLRRDEAHAVGCFDRAAKNVDRLAPSLAVVWFHVFGALAWSAAARGASGSQARRLKARARSSAGRLASWRKRGMTQHRAAQALVEAEVLRNSGRVVEAMIRYGEAQRHCQGSGALHVEALACERLGEVLRECGLHHEARENLERAERCFRGWGAEAVADALREREGLDRPGPVATSGVTTATTSSSITAATLDVEAVLRASQAIAQVSTLDDLLRRLVTLSAQSVGAQRCFLVLTDGAELTVEASVTEPGAEPTVVAHQPLAEAPVSDAIVRTVARTGEPIVLGDAASDPRFADDPFVAGARVRSVLCVPAFHQGRLVAILYLDHCDASEAFPSDRVALVQTVSSQAAISIENARVYDNLEALVGRRTAQLAEATERAEAANAAKTRFLRSMTHELRTPLNGILGYAQLLLGQDGLGEQHRSGLQTILGSGNHLLGLINDLLDVGKIEAGRLELEPVPTFLPSFVEGIARLLRPSATAKGLHLTVERAPDVPDWVEADGKRLRQVVMNLVGNALKFTDRGGVIVRVHAHASELRFDVVDTGCGIPEGQLEAVFELFEQAGGRAQRARGTGLGLTISRQLARAMGGDLTATSELGEGSTFSLRVPLVPCSAPAGEVAPVHTEAAPELKASTDHPEGTELAWPGQEVLEALLQLADEGAIRDIARQAAALADEDPAVAPFAARLAALAEDYDELGIEKLLDEGLRSGRSTGVSAFDTGV